MNRSLKFVTIALFAWGVGEGTFLLFQPIYLLELGADPVQVGAILGGMGFMMTISQIPAGYLSDRFGARPFMWTSWIWGMLAAWGMSLAPSLNWFIVALLLYGFTGSVLAPMNSYITSMRGDWSAGRALTFTSAAFHLGTVIGPTLGGFFAQTFDLRILYFFAASMFVISTAFVLFIRKPVIEYTLDTGIRAGIFRNAAFMRIAGLGMIALFFMFFTQSFTPVFLEEHRTINLQQIGFLGTIGSLGNVALALSIGHLPAYTGYLLSIPLTFFYPFLIWKGSGMWMYGAGYFLFGGYRLARSMLLALSQNVVPHRETGLAYGVIETANGVATILAPLLCGIIYNQNPERIFIIATGGLVIAFLLNYFLMPTGKQTREKDEFNRQIVHNRPD